MGRRKVQGGEEKQDAIGKRAKGIGGNKQLSMFNNQGSKKREKVGKGKGRKGKTAQTTKVLKTFVVCWLPACTH